MRRVLAIVVVLGLAPGATGSLLESVLGAHCTHACCQGQDFCHTGSEHDHDADAAMAGHHGAHESAPPFALSAIEPPSQSCLETCGVLPDARPKTERDTRAQQIETTQLTYLAPRPYILLAESKILAQPASPRGPPRQHPIDSI